MSIQDEVKAAESPLGLTGVKHVIAVASGKGGVGKSTLSLGLAIGLQSQGLKVGLLDADIYGPSQQQLLGVAANTQAEVINGKTIKPVLAQGLKTMSMAYLVNERTPMVWRGPMASSALQQMMFQTDWGELDILVVDLPPGTGDIQLTLSQKIELAGAVVVSTPSDLALLDAKKAIEMFAKVKVPLLGLVENMSYHKCESCGHQSYLFGQEGAEQIQAQYQVPILGRIPLDAHFRVACDSGQTQAYFNDESGSTNHHHAMKQIFKDIAQGVIQSLETPQSQAPVIEDIDQ